MLLIHNTAQRILQRIRWDPSVGIRRNLSVGFERLLLSQVKESDNESDRIPGCGATFKSLVLESDGILVSEFDGTYRWALTDLYY
jgi:hypothetical protein